MQGKQKSFVELFGEAVRHKHESGCTDDGRFSSDPIQTIRAVLGGRTLPPAPTGDELAERLTALDVAGFFTGVAKVAIEQIATSTDPNVTYWKLMGDIQNILLSLPQSNPNQPFMPEGLNKLMTHLPGDMIPELMVIYLTGLYAEYYIAPIQEDRALQTAEYATREAVMHVTKILDRFTDLAQTLDAGWDATPPSKRGPAAYNQLLAVGQTILKSMPKDCSSMEYILENFPQVLNGRYPNDVTIGVVYDTLLMALNCGDVSYQDVKRFTGAFIAAGLIQADPVQFERAIAKIKKNIENETTYQQFKQVIEQHGDQVEKVSLGEFMASGKDEQIISQEEEFEIVIRRRKPTEKKPTTGQAYVGWKGGSERVQ